MIIPSKFWGLNLLLASKNDCHNIFIFFVVIMCRVKCGGDYESI